VATKTASSQFSDEPIIQVCYLPFIYLHAKGCAKTMDRFSGGEDATPPKYFAPPPSLPEI
jgi:hypothetical protein